MLPLNRFVFSAFLLFFPFSLLPAEQRLEDVLEELQQLREKVDRLEARLEAIENASGPDGLAEPSEEDEKKGWFDNMRLELKKADVRASGPWTSASSWQELAEGMDEEQAVALLGEPTRRKFSIRKDTDEILIYEGDLTGSGDSVAGEVRIYKGRVARFEAPDLPQE